MSLSPAAANERVLDVPFTDDALSVSQQEEPTLCRQHAGVPHPSRVFCERVGVLTSVLATLEVKVSP
jgi:hypothetical protein